MKYLIDTDWVIDHMHNVERVAQRLEELAPEGLSISIISVAELYEGIVNATNPAGNEQALQDFLSDIEVLTVDEEVCRIFGRERARLRSAGRMIADFDLLIGTTCLRHNLTLLSNNRRHFENIEGLEIISV